MSWNSDFKVVITRLPHIIKSFFCASEMSIIHSICYHHLEQNISVMLSPYRTEHKCLSAVEKVLSFERGSDEMIPQSTEGSDNNGDHSFLVSLWSLQFSYIGLVYRALCVVSSRVHVVITLSKLIE